MAPDGSLSQLYESHAPQTGDPVLIDAVEAVSGCVGRVVVEYEHDHGAAWLCAHHLVANLKERLGLTWRPVSLHTVCVEGQENCGQMHPDSCDDCPRAQVPKNVTDIFLSKQDEAK